MIVSTIFNNFAKGRLDIDLNSRSDLASTKNGAEAFMNFYSNFKGSAIFRGGWENIKLFEDCAFVGFKFNKTQSYLFCLYDKAMKVLTYDTSGNIGFVQDGASDLVITTPYTLAESKELAEEGVSQTGDLMFIVHPSHAPRLVTRTSATTFTLATFIRTADSFGQKTITGITQANPGVVTAASHGYTSDDVVVIEDVAGMVEVNNNSYTVTVIDSNSFSIVDTSGVGFSAYTSGGIVTLSGDVPTAVDIFEGAIYYANTNNQKTTFFRSKIGDFYDMTYGTEADDAFEYDVAGLTEPIDWIRAASNSLVAGSSQGLIPINGGGVNEAITPKNVTSKISDVDGATDTLPIRKENLLFYVNAAGRNLNYFSYDIIQETFQSKDANIGSYDITKGGLSKLVYKKDRNNLIWAIRDDEDLVSLNFNLDEKIIGWHEHSSVGDFNQLSSINDNNGAVKLISLIKYAGYYYICVMAEELETPQRWEFFTGEDNEEADTLAYNRFMAEKYKEANHLDISSKVSNLYTTEITYVGDTEVGDTGTITSAGTEFTADDVGNRIYYKTETGLEYGIFEITAYTATNEVDVKVLSSPTASSYSSWYKSFHEITGLIAWAGEIFSIVADGGYLEEFEVDKFGKIALGREVTVAWFGFKYEGLIKTFNLGFQLNGVDTRATTKNISGAYFTFIASAGVQFGSTMYDMTPIQEFNPSGYWDLPPLSMNGQSEEVLYNDGFDTEKFLYIKQTKPLPCHLTGIILNVAYTTNS